ncbi:MAG: hypothetical protein PF961_18515 [Planctomycetota bacterium]|jgi:photosystem II stability/assembly factor-like uncharacterized protein|nr:hypothetical protein [Planctomycetota bacterium]
MVRACVLALLLAYAAALSWRAPAPQLPEGQPASAWPSPQAHWSTELICVDADNGQRAIVGGAVVDGGLVEHAALFTTADGGASWQAMGPALSGGRFLAIARQAKDIWAIGHDDDRHGGALFALRSTDGMYWRRHLLDTTPFPGFALNHARLTVINPEHAVATGAFSSRPGERASFTTADGGRHWQFRLARSAPNFDRDRESVTTASGWSWRLRDGIVERRGPGDDQWIPTRSQPLDGVAATDLSPYTAMLGNQTPRSAR